MLPQISSSALKPEDLGSNPDQKIICFLDIIKGNIVTIHLIPLKSVQN